jgi:hypothetical protein
MKYEVQVSIVVEENSEDEAVKNVNEQLEAANIKDYFFFDDCCVEILDDLEIIEG